MKVKDKKIKRSDLQIKVYKLKLKREEEESNEIRHDRGKMSFVTFTRGLVSFNYHRILVEFSTTHGLCLYSLGLRKSNLKRNTLTHLYR